MFHTLDMTDNSVLSRHNSLHGSSILWRRLNKPEYWFRPSQTFRRLSRIFRRFPPREVVLPWTLPVAIHPADDISKAIWTLGIYDLNVSEAIWRLLGPGGVAVDAGANIGHMTGLMAARCGPSGTVLAFEPHPRIFAELERNIARWKNAPISRICAYNCALSSTARLAALEEPEDFHTNRGIAHLTNSPDSRNVCFRVRCVRLDDHLPDVRNIDVLKLDVEGHEFDVMKGAQELLARKALRHIIFENNACSFDAEIVSLLKHYGYDSYLLTRTFFGPQLADTIESQRYPHYLPCSFVASAAPDEMRARFRPRGWRVLRSSGALSHVAPSCRSYRTD
jgi:FkbM family methyltransferase